MSSTEIFQLWNELQLQEANKVKAEYINGNGKDNDSRRDGAFNSHNTNTSTRPTSSFNSVLCDRKTSSAAAQLHHSVSNGVSSLYKNKGAFTISETLAGLGSSACDVYVMASSWSFAQTLYIMFRDYR